MKTWDDYATGWRDLHGGFDPRRASPLVRGWLRLAYRVGRRAVQLGATPTTVTVVGLALSLLVPVAAPAGRVGAAAAALLVLLSAVADSVDGAVAVITDRASRLATCTTHWPTGSARRPGWWRCGWSARRPGSPYRPAACPGCTSTCG